MNFLYAQAPNRKGNVSKMPPAHKAVTGGTSKLATPKGAQGNQKAPDAHGHDNQAAMKQPVKLSTPKPYCGHIENDGYLKNSSYLK